MNVLHLYGIFFLEFLSSAFAPALPLTTTSYLTRRQVSACCLYYCSPFTAASNACGTNSTCLCSPTIASMLYACASCQLIMHDATWADLEYSVGVYSTECADSGNPITYMTLVSC